MQHTDTYFGEVIESSLNHCIAQCWEWDTVPCFGSLVTIRQNERLLFGIVYHIQTGSIDTSRTPFAYKKTPEQLKKEQPHIFEFLKTTISCSIVGYHQNASLFFITPPQPPHIHAFVARATTQEERRFFNSCHFLQSLFAQQNTIGNIDELLVSLLQYGIVHASITSQDIYTLMHTYVLLVGNDYRRIKLFSQRIQNLIS